MCLTVDYEAAGVVKHALSQLGNIFEYKLIRFVIAPDGFAVADLAGHLPGQATWVAANDATIRIADQEGYLSKRWGLACDHWMQIYQQLLAVA